MNDLVFITGNQNKADYMARFLGGTVKHHKLDLDELQSLDHRKVLEHKVRQAYDILKKPVLVEDVSLTLTAMGRLPGTFIKYFVGELGNEGMCRMLDSFDSREAVAVVCYALHDGKEIRYFEGEMRGSIAKKPMGTRGFGYDPIFINDGYTITRGQMTQEEYDLNSGRFKALHKLKAFLES